MVYLLVLIITGVVWYIFFNEHPPSSKQSDTDVFQNLINQESSRKYESNNISGDLFLEASENYIWNLNDSIKYFNKLDKFDKGYVIAGVKDFKGGILQSIDEASVNWIKDKMNYWTSERQNLVAEGPSARWVLASINESICHMYFSGDNESVVTFLSNPIFK